MNGYTDRRIRTQQMPHADTSASCCLREPLLVTAQATDRD
jgi:hypothetical protein